MKWKYIITIKCDVNDGDLISRVTIINEEKYKKYQGVFEKIITTPIPHNCGTRCTERDIDIINWLVENCEISEDDSYDFINMFFPYPVDDFGWHTIYEIVIKRIPADILVEAIAHYKISYRNEPTKEFVNI